MDVILTLTDDVLINELSKISDPEVRKIVDDYMKRNLLTMVEEIRDLLPDINLNMGKGLSQEIKQQAGLGNEVTVIIDVLKGKKAIKPPPTTKALGHLEFYDLKSKKLKPPNQKIQGHTLSSSPAYKLRIYIENDPVIKSSVEKTLKRILK